MRNVYKTRACLDFLSPPYDASIQKTCSDVGLKRITKTLLTGCSFRFAVCYTHLTTTTSAYLVGAAVIFPIVVRGGGGGGCGGGGVGVSVAGEIVAVEFHHGSLGRLCREEEEGKGVRDHLDFIIITTTTIIIIVIIIIIIIIISCTVLLT